MEEMKHAQDLPIPSTFKARYNPNNPNALGHVQFINSEEERPIDILFFRLECLKMATLHATQDQIETGAVYKIAEDYYDYIINGKKLINNGNS